MRSWGLKSRFLFAAVVVLAAAGLLSSALFLAMARGIAERLGARFAAANTELAATRILGIVERETALAQKLADSPVVRAWIEDESDPAKRELARSELESYRRAFADGSYFVAVASSRSYYNQPAQGPRTQVKLSPERDSDAWFFKALGSDRPCQLNLDYNPYIHATKVWINCLVRTSTARGDGPRGAPLALVGTGIDISSFIAELEASAPEGLSLVLADAEGNLTAHPNLALLEANAKSWGESRKLAAVSLADSPADRRGLEALLAGGGGIRTARLSFEGKRSLVAVADLEGLGWKVIAVADLGPMITVASFAAIPLAFVATLVLSLLALALLVDRGVLAPILSLSAAARRLAQGDYELALPVAAVGEIGELGRSFAAMAREVRAATEGLERQVAARTRELAEANAKMRGDLAYAEIVQGSILPDPAALDRFLPERFVLFQPRDRVGGDFYFLRDLGGDFLLGLADCTGHGVSGALMTMFAASAIDLIVGGAPAGASANEKDPAECLAELDRHLRSGLEGKERGLGSERGLDLALCRIEPRRGRLLFAGAGLDLFVAWPGGAERLRTGRGSLGSRRRPAEPRSRVIPLEGRTFFLASDGILDQAGGERGYGFGARRFLGFAAQAAELDLAEAKLRLEAALADWRGDRPQRDDISVVAWRCRT